jgi:hypothetical protein
MKGLVWHGCQLKIVGLQRIVCKYHHRQVINVASDASHHLPTRLRPIYRASLCSLVIYHGAAAANKHTN